jgi:DNA-binding PadR family transcriptional regulator
LIDIDHERYPEDFYTIRAECAGNTEVCRHSFLQKNRPLGSQANSAQALASNNGAMTPSEIAEWTQTEREGKRPERRVYQITKKGKSYFLQLLRDNLDGFTHAYFNDDVGIGFMDRFSTDEVCELLEKKRGKIQSLLKQFQEVPDHGRNWHYVIAHNITHLKADLAWIDSILSELDDVRT